MIRETFKLMNTMEHNSIEETLCGQILGDSHDENNSNELLGDSDYIPESDPNIVIDQVIFTKLLQSIYYSHLYKINYDIQ